MPLDSEFLLSVKDHVTSKLKSLGAFIDEELPDYIMVMIANKKSEASMAKDLQLFLGEHTEEFTKWLHLKLEELKHPSHASRGKSRDKEHGHTSAKAKSSSGKKKGQRSHNESSASRTESRSRSRSPLGLGSQRPGKGVSSREPHGEIELLNLHAEENEFTNEGISSTDVVQEERKVVSTATLKSRGAEVHEMEGKPQNPDSAHIRSVVQIKEDPSARRPKVDRQSSRNLQPIGLLLKRAVDEAKANIINDEPHSSSSAKRKLANHPVACSDVSSSSTNDSPKFYVTLSGADISAIRRSANRDSDVNSSYRAKIVRPSLDRGVKSRLGSRQVLPYVRPKTTKLSVKERLGPNIRISSSNDVFPVEPDDGFSYDALDQNDADIVELVEEEPDEEQGQLTWTGHLARTLLPMRASQVAADSRPVSKSRLADQLKQRNLIVSLNETDEDEDISTLVEKQDNTRNEGTNVAVSSGDTENSTKQSNIPSSLERCRYWPNCRNGSNCSYIHPHEPCPTFPRCRLGSSCTFIHPPCRYGAFCTRPDCAFAHPTPKATPKTTVVPVSPGQIVCRFQNRCTNPCCPFYHPPSRSNTAASVPLSVSPILCRYGAACTNRPKCPFSHRDTPAPDKLKWVAPSKQAAKSEGQQQAALASDSSVGKSGENKVDVSATAIPVS
ncbi:unnamed protein product [Calicophoron daubneyi]|uniref:Zinc finger CCCH domain-containing protein 14 n=1 Tax=Calicophoron daubneyi TaxID=300641 RepID=A0AAV2TPE1_CALDB